MLIGEYERDYNICKLGHTNISYKMTIEFTADNI